VFNTCSLFLEETTINKDTAVINEKIRARELRTIDDNGDQLGILAMREALRIAQEKGLDLVLVAADANPPVAKIMDYGRHKFETEKKTREARKKQHVVTLKELTLSYKIGEHDYQVRLRSLRKFITEGDKVKVTIRFRGREVQHSGLAAELLMRFARDIEDIGIIEREPRSEGRTLFIILAPKKEK
jgi:translation initiation factor IF-3